MATVAGNSLVRVTDTVYAAHTPHVNWTLVTGDNAVLLIDAGFPGDRSAVLASLAELGYRPADVAAVLLTHAHVDHFGTAIWLAGEHHVPVYCHADEVGHARRDYLEQASPAQIARQAWRPRWLRWSLEIARLGALTRAGIPTAAALTPELAAALPGAPRAVPTPGHTGGHCSYLVGSVLVSGDALVTGHPVSDRVGPQLLPSVFNHDEARCRASLTALADVDAEILVPGHGEVWHAPIRELAAQAHC
ncbi:MAG: MBL fold metallo-hydrolase [Mycolicibacterium sp.]|nr:MBL fold metallo-hydrolase [Mycolicibacterium sp.]